MNQDKKNELWASIITTGIIFLIITIISLLVNYGSKNSICYKYQEVHNRTCEDLRKDWHIIKTKEKLKKLESED